MGGIIRSGTWQHRQDMHVSLQMLALMAALLPYVESGMDQKCSDRFYDTCILPNPEVATHEISLEACQLACKLQQTLGFCDWFIFTPHDYQSCKMFTKSLGDLEDYLDGRCFAKGGSTCETDVDASQCPDKCDGCHRCGDNQAKDKCNFVHDIGCSMDASLGLGDPKTGAEDFESCKSICLNGLDGFGYTYAVWNPLEAPLNCLCYTGGDRQCNSYAVRLDVPPGGDLGTCLSQSVNGRFKIILPALFFLSFGELFQLPC